MLTQGNLKLGTGVWHWNLPAGSAWSCPGASAWCDASLFGGCYAEETRHPRSYGSAHVKAIYRRNWEAVQTENLAQWCRDMTEWITLKNKRARHLRNQVRVVRIHTSGDFFSTAYINAWRSVALRCPDVKFYAYTRSWVIPELVEMLEAFRAMPNVTLWASWDSTMEQPPTGWPVASVARREDGIDTDRFRFLMLCPEQAGRKPDCTSCGVCWAPKLKAEAQLLFRQH